MPQSFWILPATRTVRFEVNEWYAPNVGLVKLTHEERTNSEEMLGGKMALELVAFEH